MTRIIITGANGKMGHVIRSVVAGREDCTVVAGVDFNTQAADFPIYKTIAEVQEEADVIIDFSNPALLDDLLAYSAAKSMPLVIATTGYTAEQKAKIEAAAEKCPIFFTYNMSMGKRSMYWDRTLTLRLWRSTIIRRSTRPAAQH